MDARLATGPLGRQFVGHGLHAFLVAAGVADQHDLPETMRAIARANIRQQPAVGVFAQADRARVLHMLARRVDGPLGHEADDRRHQSVAQLAGDGLGRRPQHDVVLAGDQVGPVLLNAAGGHDHGILPAAHGVADLHPSHVLDEQRIHRVDRPRRIEIGANRRRLGRQRDDG